MTSTIRTNILTLIIQSLLNITYHVRWRLSVGSKHSQQNDSLSRRDDSFIWWDLKGKNSKRKYGRVLVFGRVLTCSPTWDPVAVVRAFEKVVLDKELGTLKIEKDLGHIQTILVKDIGVERKGKRRDGIRKCGVKFLGSERGDGRAKREEAKQRGRHIYIQRVYKVTWCWRI